MDRSTVCRNMMAAAPFLYYRKGTGLVRENIVTVAFGIISTGDGVGDRNQGTIEAYFFCTQNPFI